MQNHDTMNGHLYVIVVLATALFWCLGGHSDFSHNHADAPATPPVGSETDGHHGHEHDERDHGADTARPSASAEPELVTLQLTDSDLTADRASVPVTSPVSLHVVNTTSQPRDVMVFVTVDIYEQYLSGGEWYPGNNPLTMTLEPGAEDRVTFEFNDGLTLVVVPAEDGTVLTDQATLIDVE